MSEADHFVLLARYNQLMNQRQYDAASGLSEADLLENKGAFFGSILGTLNHILVGDIVWLKRFSVLPSGRESLSYCSGLEQPKSLDAILFTDLDALRSEREKVDQIVIEWVKQLTDADLTACVRYENMAGKRFSKQLSSLAHHLFLHQAHHRGQVTTLLSQCGVDFGETDLVELIAECGT